MNSATDVCCAVDWSQWGKLCRVRTSSDRSSKSYPVCYLVNNRVLTVCQPQRIVQQALQSATVSVLYTTPCVVFDVRSSNVGQCVTRVGIKIASTTIQQFRVHKNTADRVVGAYWGVKTGSWWVVHIFCQDAKTNSCSRGAAFSGAAGRRGEK